MAKTTVKTTTTAKTTETTTSMTEEMFKSNCKENKTPDAAIKTALAMSGGNFGEAWKMISFLSGYTSEKKKEVGAKKEKREESSAEEKARISAIFRAACPKLKTGAPDYIFGIRDEERKTKNESGEKIVKDRLVGIRFERGGIDRCFQALVPVYRKRGNISKTTEELEKEVNETLAILMREVVSTSEM